MIKNSIFFVIFLFLISNAAADIIFEEDFEDGIDSRMGQEKPASHSINVVSATDTGEGVRAGNNAVRFELRCYDPLMWGHRTELGMQDFDNLNPMFSQRWYGVSIFLPEDFVYDDDVWLIFFQWHGYDGVSPPLALEYRSGQWSINYRWQGSMGDHYVDVSPIDDDKGKWTDWVFHVRWDYRTDGDGFAKAWKDGEQVFDYNGPIGNGNYGTWMKFGIYRGSGTHCPRIVYHDEFKIGDENSNYEEVAPGNGIPSVPACNDSIDNDRDELIDMQDPGCDSLNDTSEYNPPPPECSDGIDNDGNNLADYPDDPGCDSSEDAREYTTPPLPDGAIEAESCTISSPMSEVQDDESTGGYHVLTSTENSGVAECHIDIAESGAYKFTGRVNPTSTSGDSFFVSVDGDPEILWDFPLGHNDWREEEVSSRGAGTYDNPEVDPYVIYLSQGRHTITFRGRETNAKLDYFYLTPTDGDIETCQSLGHVCCEICGSTAYPEYDDSCQAKVCCGNCRIDTPESQLISDFTLIADSGNIDSAHPIGNMWDGCLENTPECSTGVSDGSSFWAELDLGKNHNLTRVRIFGDTDGTWVSSTWSISYKLYLADEWIPAFEGRNAYISDWIDEPVDLQARYIRVDVNSDTGSTQARELEMYGVEAGKGCTTLDDLKSEINFWKQNQRTIQEVMNAIVGWKRGCI